MQTQSMTLQKEQQQSDKIAARETLSKETEGIEALHAIIDENFSAIVDLIISLKGRLIVSGMGKSGHIARKIAATMASTGTPALFVHPAEASHGDLGMITKEDAVMLLSNSGETAELKDVINYTRRFSIPLIGMVRRQSSALVKASNFSLILPEVPEASPINAPTTSTTMMLALGDALAMALLQRHGLTPSDFNTFHPGGKLGSAFLNVSDVMHSGDAFPHVEEDQLMSEVIIEMTSKGLGCAAVLDKQGELKGIITDGDLRRHMHPEFIHLPAKEVMTTQPLVIERETLASQALNIMNSRNITSLFVMDGQHAVGVVHIHDLLRAGVM